MTTKGLAHIWEDLESVFDGSRNFATKRRQCTRCKCIQCWVPKHGDETRADGKPKVMSYVWRPLASWCHKKEPTRE